MPILRYGSSGAYVQLLQSTLKKLGFYSGEIDGIFGTQTLEAVQYFQREFGIAPDGIVGNATWSALTPYLNGSTFDIVPTDIIYPYSIMMMNIRTLMAKYPFLEFSYYGKSVMGKNIPVIKIGKGEKEVFYSAGIHANEWINSVVFMKFIEDFAKAYEEDSEIFGYNARNIFDNVSLYIVPMANPDGIDLVLWQLPARSARYINARNIASNFPEIPFPDGWKANIVGVDLNLQFPAEWELVREIKYGQGFIRPAPRDFVGYGPLTEPESLALYEFTLSHNFSLILSYHTQGEVIFWRYLNFEPEGAEELGREFARVSGYILDDTMETNSYAGYRDWFISSYNKPGYTVETGLGQNPLPISQFDEIYKDNLGILVLGAKV